MDQEIAGLMGSRPQATPMPTPSPTATPGYAQAGATKFDQNNILHRLMMLFMQKMGQGQQPMGEPPHDPFPGVAPTPQPTPAPSPTALLDPADQLQANRISAMMQRGATGFSA